MSSTPEIVEVPDLPTETPTATEPVESEPPTGTIGYTWVLTPDATIYDVYVNGTQDAVVEVDVPRRFWFGHRKVLIPVPGVPATPIWRIDTVAQEIKDYGNLQNVALIPKTQ